MSQWCTDVRWWFNAWWFHMYHGPGVSDSEGTQEYVGSDRSDPASPYLSWGPESSDSDATQEFRHED